VLNENISNGKDYELEDLHRYEYNEAVV